MKRTIILFLLCTLCTLSSCALLKPDYESPSVGLKSFRMLPASQGMLPEFEIGLHLINPNRNALPLEGIFYTISLEGEKLLSGVAHDLPTVQGYGEADIFFHATIDLIGGIQLMNKLLNGHQPTMKYSFTAKIDTGRLSPPLTIREEGNLRSLYGGGQGGREEL